MSSAQRGVVVKWFDDKGYGFIEPSSGGGLRFFHVSSVRNSARRDLLGQRVTFREAEGRDGRPAAEDVFLACEGPVAVDAGGRRAGGYSRRRRRRFHGGTLVAWVMGLGFLGVVGGGVRLGYWPDYVFFVYAGMSLLTFMAYAGDKAKAGTGQWRTPESTLHTLELLGGWPGALVAQWQIGHKNRKGSYQAVFWFIVILHLGVLWKVPMEGWPSFVAGSGARPREEVVVEFP